MALFRMQEIADYVGATILAGSKDTVISKFSTNSKQGDMETLFVPIKGEHFDAHDFIKDAFDHGMRATFTKRNQIVPATEGMTYLLVDDPVAALQKLGEVYRTQFSTPIVGITGSVGKTTTKEMIAAALEPKKCVLKTIGNMNSQVGLPQMMTKLEKKHEIAIIEMGISLFGEMDRLVKIARPETVVMTNIGLSHIGQLLTKENIRSEKANICNFMTEKGLLLVNGDDPLLYEIYDAFRKDQPIKDQIDKQEKLHFSKITVEKLQKATVKTYGTSPSCSVYADNIRTGENGTSFNYHYKDGNDHWVQESVTIPVLGEHNVLNALAALQIASFYQVSLQEAEYGLSCYQPIAMRGAIEHCNDLTIIDDTYNASPDSMKGSINIITELAASKRKVIIFADVLELGEYAKEGHCEVGRYIAQRTKTNQAPAINLLITIGPNAHYIASEVNQYRKDIQTISFATRMEASEQLKALIQKGDTILLKGSRGMQLEYLVNQLKQMKWEG